MQRLWRLRVAVALVLAVTFSQGLRAEPAPLSTQDDRLRQADELESAARYSEAVAIYESLVSSGGGRDPRWTAYILFRQACAQSQTGDRAGALESVNAAAMLDPSEPSYQAFMVDLQGRLSAARRPVLYQAARDSGSARRLISTNGVLHIFVRGRNSDRWETEDQDALRRRIAESDQWVQERSRESRVTTAPVFVHRYLSLSDEPFWRRIDVPDGDSRRDYRDAWLDAVLVRFQANTFAELFDRVFEGVDFDNRSVVFHAARSDLSATPALVLRKGARDLECALVESQGPQWLNVFDAVTYTRGVMRLYGADDLQTKAREPGVPEHEIMNFGAGRLEDCALCDLTRYAIGWTDAPPRLKRLRLAQNKTTAKSKRGA